MNDTDTNVTGEKVKTINSIASQYGISSTPWRMWLTKKKKKKSEKKPIIELGEEQKILVVQAFLTVDSLPPSGSLYLNDFK